MPQLNIRLDPAVLKALKVQAAMRGVTVQKFVTQAITARLPKPAATTKKVR